MAIEIVDFPIKNGGSFHSFLYVYQRVQEMNGDDEMINLPLVDYNSII